MSSEWRTATVEAIAAPYSTALATGPFGSSISSKFFTDAGMPVIRGSNLSTKVSTRLDDDGLVFVSNEKATEFQRSVARRGDLVFTCWGTINQIGLIDARSKFESYIVSNKQMKLTVDPLKADARFIYYVFSGPDKQAEILDNGIGSSVPGFNLGQLKRHEIALPPLPEQIRIADSLEQLDDRITLLRETNATLEAIAQALFKSWFVDFDPVRAKMEGRAPEGMDEATARLFPDSYEESALGLVPRGWRVDSVYTVSTLIYGAPFASKQFNSNHDGAPLIRIRDLRDEAPGLFTPEVHPKGYMVQPGDIVVGMDGEFRAYLWGGEPAWLNQRVCVFAPKAGCPAAFVHRAITPLLAAVEASETATTVIHLGKNDIDRFRILIPAQSVLTSFGQLTDGLYSKIVNNKQSARTLSALRDTLLPRLISGKLRLTESQQEMEGALR